MAETNGKTDDVAEEPQATTEPESNDDVAVEEAEAGTDEKSDPEPDVAAEEKPESEPEDEETQTEDEPEPAPEPKVVQSGSNTDLIVQQKGNGWIVRNDGSDEILERFDTRAEAFRHARKLTSSQGGEVYVLVS